MEDALQVRSQEAIIRTMCLAYILNPQPACHVAYAGHPPFSHASMGMLVLNSGFDVLLIANEEAYIEQLSYGNEDESVASSPTDYDPPSPSSSELSTLQGTPPTSPCLPEKSTSELSTLQGSQPTSPCPPEKSPNDGKPQVEKKTNSRMSSAALPSGTSTIGGCGTGDWASSTAPKMPVFSDGYDHYPREFPAVHMPVYSDGYDSYPREYPVAKAALMSSSSPLPLSRVTEQQRVPLNSCTNETVAPRYEDGEVLRYGAGESYRPFNNAGNRDRGGSPPRRARSPIRARSPVRDRDMRARSPPVAPDSYVPNRSPRRRSRSADRYRGPDRARDIGGESWRRRDPSRSRVRSPLRRTPPRRRSPGRFSPGPRRDDRLFDRARSPRRDFDIRDR